MTPADQINPPPPSEPGQEVNNQGPVLLQVNLGVSDIFTQAFRGHYLWVSLLLGTVVLCSTVLSAIQASITPFVLSLGVLSTLLLASWIVVQQPRRSVPIGLLAMTCILLLVLTAIVYGASLLLSGREDDAGSTTGILPPTQTPAGLVPTLEPKDNHKQAHSVEIATDDSYGYPVSIPGWPKLNATIADVPSCMANVVRDDIDGGWSIAAIDKILGQKVDDETLHPWPLSTINPKALPKQEVAIIACCEKCKNRTLFVPIGWLDVPESRTAWPQIQWPADGKVDYTFRSVMRENTPRMQADTSNTDTAVRVIVSTEDLADCEYIGAKPPQTEFYIRDLKYRHRTLAPGDALYLAVMMRN